MTYLFFFIKCLKNKCRFFFLPLKQKATVLEKNRLYFFAGILYLELKDYSRAAFCFEITHSYYHLIFAYQKLGLYSKAIEIADRQKYYKKGASLCEKINNPKKAAYFYAYFRPLYAAKLYKTESFFYEAGQCYLKINQYSSALECFKNCSVPDKKAEGLNQIEEIAIVLYFTRQYEEAFKLFIRLKDYYSALECAKKLKTEPLIKQVHFLISQAEAKNQNYYTAARFIEPYDKHKALIYYYLCNAVQEAIRLLVEEKSYDKAFNLCIQRNDLALAYKLANTYHLPLNEALCPG